MKMKSSQEKIKAQMTGCVREYLYSCEGTIFVITFDFAILSNTTTKIVVIAI